MDNEKELAKKYPVETIRLQTIKLTWVINKQNRIILFTQDAASWVKAAEDWIYKNCSTKNCFKRVSFEHGTCLAQLEEDEDTLHVDSKRVILFPYGDALHVNCKRVVRLMDVRKNDSAVQDKPDHGEALAKLLGFVEYVHPPPFKPTIIQGIIGSCCWFLWCCGCCSTKLRDIPKFCEWCYVNDA
jgi:hypothetical protein